MNLVIPSVLLALGAGSSLAYAAAELTDGGSQECQSKRKTQCETTVRVESKSGCSKGQKASAPGCSGEAPAAPVPPPAPAPGSVVWPRGQPAPFAPAPAPAPAPAAAPAPAPAPAPAAAPASPSRAVVWASAAAPADGQDGRDGKGCQESPDGPKACCPASKALELPSLNGEVSQLVERALELENKCASSRPEAERELLEQAELLSKRWVQQAEQIAAQWEANAGDLAAHWSDHAADYEEHLALAAEAMAQVDSQSLADAAGAWQHALALVDGQALAIANEPVALQYANTALARAQEAVEESELEARVRELEALLADRAQRDNQAWDGFFEGAGQPPEGYLDRGGDFPFGNHEAYLHEHAEHEHAEHEHAEHEHAEHEHAAQEHAEHEHAEHEHAEHEHAAQERAEHEHVQEHAEHVHVQEQAEHVHAQERAEHEQNPWSRRTRVTVNGERVWESQDGFPFDARDEEQGSHRTRWFGGQAGAARGFRFQPGFPGQVMATAEQRDELRELVRELRGEVRELRETLGDLRAEMKHLSADGER